MLKILKYIENLVIKYQNSKILSSLSTKNITTILDIGGHHGEFYYSAMKDKINFEKYFIFQSYTSSFNIISQIKDQRLHPYQLAVGSEKKEMNLQVNKWDTSNSFSEVNENNYKMKIKKILLGTKSSSFVDVEKVKIQTLDNLFFNELKSIELLKIDTEGFEYEVLLGAKKLLKNRTVKNIIIEFQDEDTYVNYSPLKIHEFLITNGFKLKEIYKIRFIGLEDRLYSLD